MAEASTPQITPPYGFQEVVALAKTHRVLLPKGHALPMAFRNMNPLPVSFTEFTVAGRDYPLVFTPATKARASRRCWSPDLPPSRTCS